MALGCMTIQLCISSIVLFSVNASLELSLNDSTTAEGQHLQGFNFKYSYRACVYIMSLYENYKFYSLYVDMYGSGNQNNINRNERQGNSTFWEAKELSQNIVFSPNMAGKRTTSEMQLYLPTSIEVISDSILYVESGQSANINFQVTNNRYSQLFYSFDATSEDLIIHQIQPRRLYILSMNSAIVNVRASPSEQYRADNLNTKILTFSARWSTLLPFNQERVIKRVYVHMGKQPSDSSKPSVSYTFNGDCSGSLDPKNCIAKIWRAELTIEDADSGLLMIKSIPVGLVLNKEFIVGTKETVTGYYRATCCQTKVDIVARDLNGNERTLEIDIERIWLSTGEIVSIALGSILLLILIISIIICVVCIRRRKRRSLNIYPESSRSREI